jgi:CRP-like cAMP-binding protein
MSVLLESLEGAERAAAAEALVQCAPLRLAVGEARLRIDDAVCLVVEDGVVLVTSARAGASRRMVVAVAGPGAVLLPPAPGERLEAATGARLTAVGAPAYAALLRVPGAAAALVEALAEQLRERQESLAQFSSVRHVERVRDKLLQLARAYGRVVPGGVRLDLPLTHELVGEMVGSARETVTWAFAELSREGFVRRDGRSYRLAVAPEALAS